MHFVGIGAQKSATTTLHHWLRDHPRLSLPASKEAPFFNSVPAPTSAQFRQWQEDTFPAHACHPDVLLGKFTPQYMCFGDAATSLARLCPDVKLIVCLRDPVERARSHWRMRVRIGCEDRPFATAIAQCLDLPHAPLREEEGYVAFGEYGRVLSLYRGLFPDSSFLFLFDRDVEATPQETVDLVTEFLGVENFTPSSLGVRYNTAPRPSSKAARVVGLLPYKTLASRTSPRVQARWGGWMDRLGVPRPASTLPDQLPDDLHAQLVRHFREDARLLTQMGVSPYWLDDVRG